MLASKAAPQYINYSYDNMRQGLLDIIRSMNLDDWKPDAVLGLTRGGLVPAVMMSHYYDVQMIPVNLSLRDFKSDFATVVNELDQSIKLDSKKFKNILVLDDILDSGETMKQLKDIFNMLEKFSHFNIKYATLFFNINNEAQFQPDYYSEKMNKGGHSNPWIIFNAWESWWKS